MVSRVLFALRSAASSTLSRVQASTWAMKPERSAAEIQALEERPFARGRPEDATALRAADLLALQRT